MGEYAKLNGEEIKIGTCEDMYYLRAGQAHLVEVLPGNVDPVADRFEIRFRFPFPDEDGIGPGPGSFKDHERGAGLHMPVPDHVEHYGKCDARSMVYVTQQKWVGDKLVLVLACECGSAWRLPTIEDAAPYVQACILRGEQETGGRGDFWREVARRIMAGYRGEVI